MTSSVSVDHEMANALFDTACIMIRDSSSRKSVKVEGLMEGLVTTKHEDKSFGTVAGTEFFAEVETDLGKGKIKYIVRDADAKTRNKLVWAPLFSIEDFVAEVSPPGRGNAAFN